MKLRIERLVLLSFDTLLMIAGLYMAYLLRFDFSIPIDYLQQLYLLVPALVWVRFSTISYYQGYRVLLRFFSYADLILFIKPFLLGTVLLIFINIFRNIYFMLVLLGGLTYLNHKKVTIVFYLERLKKVRLMRFPFFFIIFVFLSGLYWLNLYYNEQLIPFKELLRSTFIFSNYPSEKAIPRTIILMEMALNFWLLMMMRVTYRYLHEKRELEQPVALPTLIYGANQWGAQLASQLQLLEGEQAAKLMGFIDDRSELWGQRVGDGLVVWGGQEILGSLVERFKIAQIIVANPNFRGEKLETLIKRAGELEIKVQIIPEEDSDIQKGKMRLIRNVRIEDLLDRKIQHTVQELNLAVIESKVVLITGAGGSIGSELTRQIADYHPAKILLLGKGENSIYHIHNEIVNRFPEIECIPLIADVCDTARIQTIFNQFHPHLVFHAAAHKHVPLMEANPGEALKNNFLGTIRLAQIADLYHVERFIFISTDKAVNPANIMGASKRLAEIFLLSVMSHSQTQFIIVRFGNVLGSRGSVVPLFLEQIRLGGPLTVTDPQVFRYFITIPEAVRLVLKSAEVGHNSNIFILDMGQQINILKLAENLIYLAGLRPYQDIPIQFTGLRPGEKLTEELVTRHESVHPTPYPGLFQTSGTIPDSTIVLNLKEELESQIVVENTEQCYLLLQKMFPGLKFKTTSKSKRLTSDA